MKNQTKQLPFQILPGNDITRQLVDGLRSGIDAGFWKPGDTLPSAAELQHALKIGGFAPRTALRQLADEGIIVLKKHVGATVTSRTRATRHGRIAFITSGRRESYYENVHAFALQGLFEEAGWELVHVIVPRPADKAGKTEVAMLERQLRLGLDFAICFTESRAVSTMLDTAHVRYICEGGSGRDFPNALATINLELESQNCVEQLAGFWKTNKVKNVLVVDFEHVMPRNVLSSFAQANMTLRRLVVPQPKGQHYLQGIQQAGLDAVSKFFAVTRNRENPPDALFFYDDYLASGGLIALAATGLRVPEDLRIATLANKGLGPVWFKPLTRLEYDPVGNAKLIGGYVLKLLAGKDVTPPSLTLKFIEGAT